MKKRSSSGSIIILVLLLLLPSFLLLLKSLEMRKNLTAWMLDQQKLDACLVEILKPRCETLTALSKLNSRLKQIQKLALAVLAAGLVRPELLAALKKLRTVSNVIKSRQDQLLAMDAIRVKALPLKIVSCGGLQQTLLGLLTKKTHPLNLAALGEITRRSVLQLPAGTAPPLEWSALASNASRAKRNLFLRILGSGKEIGFPLETFGSCRSDSKNLAALSGESYALQFR